MKKKILLILVAIFVMHLFFRIYSYKDAYLTPFDPMYWESRYLKSQWVDPNSQESIGDDGLFTYAAWEYIRGGSPFTIVPAYPPLGMYILGATIVIFKNQNIFALIVGLLSLYLFYLVNLELVKGNKLLAFIPVVLFSFDPLFFTQLRAPYFDLLHLVFLLLTFLFFLKKNYPLTFIFLAAFTLTKFPYLSIFILFSFIVWFLLNKNFKDLKKFVLFSPIFPIVYTLAHIRYFMLNHSFLEFMGAHKWIIDYYVIGAKADFGIVYPMIFTGSWKTWWDGIIRVDEWTILWPIAFVLTLVHVFLLSRQGFKNLQFPVIFWCVVYLSFLSFIPVWPRYLLLLLPFLYNHSIWFLSKNIKPRLFSLLES